MRLLWKWCMALGGALMLTAAVQPQTREPVDVPPYGKPIELLGLEGMHGGRVVKGAPFSATATSETTQTLQDGSQIHRSTQIVMYRDGEGRSRHETTFNGFGPLATEGKSKTMISISDPVTGELMVLDGENKVARKMVFRWREALSPEATTKRQTEREARRAEEEAAGLLKTESLGTQTVNGVFAEGTRVTRTIPAGQIGNDRALQVLSERWYSPDLQIVVKSTHTDPRFGTTAYNVTNIQKGEPEATLFSVPSGYTVLDGRTTRRLLERQTPQTPQPPED
ncbi:MAG TPA: hypothetical protein VJN42_11010 [Candidatus Acidoferrum sp.]|nr:hypothetical protein [Candidatus Acidoferrum sp.]